jgi:hypothetical protein
MAAQLMRSARYCGTTGSRNPGGGRETQVVHRQEESPSDSQAGIDIIRAVQLGTTSEPVPDERGRPTPINSWNPGNRLGIDTGSDQLQTVCIGFKSTPYSL